jgi:hypothetical protein
MSRCRTLQQKETLQVTRKQPNKSQYISSLKPWLAPKDTIQKWKKICYAVVMSARKFPHYFEVHRVRVLMNQPLNDIFGNRDSFGRISKWAMDLSENVIDFEKKSAIKWQVLADFITDWLEPANYTEGSVPESPWQVYCDGARGNARAGALALFISPSGIKLRYAT